jgi:hypothetical protein
VLFCEGLGFRGEREGETEACSLVDRGVLISSEVISSEGRRDRGDLISS